MNSELQGNDYRVPEVILNKITAKLYTNPSDAEGIKRAKFILKNGACSYEQLKRLKNFFDKFNSGTDPIEQFELAGGREMRNFVEQTLKDERDRTAREKDIKRPILAGTNTNGLKAQVNNSITDMHESFVSETTESELSLNAVVAIFDSDMRILMLKRSSYPDQWMPDKWSLPGGKIEQGEDPAQAAIREVFEETGIQLEKVIEKFVIQRNNTNVEHLFIAKLPNSKNLDDIKLDKENAGYAWMATNEIKDMDTVPNVLDYVKIAAEKYE